MNLGPLSLGLVALRAGADGTSGAAATHPAKSRFEYSRFPSARRAPAPELPGMASGAGKRTRRADPLGSLLFGLCALATLAGCVVHLARLLTHWPWLIDLVRSLVG